MFRTSSSLTLLAALSLSLLTSNSSRCLAEDSKAIDVLGKAKIVVPSDFKPAARKSRIIEHEFKVGEGDKTARLTMMRAGGGVEPNIKRWKGQFSGGKKEDQKTEKFEAGPLEIHIVDVSGTYAESMGGGPFAPGKKVKRENYAMTGAIFVSEEGLLYFAKMIGPAEIIKANREKFIKMAKSVGK